MMNRKIINYKNELIKKSKLLRETAFDIKDFEKSQQIRQEQNEIYKKHEFVKNLLNELDKNKEGD